MVSNLESRNYFYMIEALVRNYFGRQTPVFIFLFRGVFLGVSLGGIFRLTYFGGV